MSEYRQWSKEDKEQLLQYIEEELDTDEIAEMLDRTPGSIEFETRKLMLEESVRGRTATANTPAKKSTQRKTAVEEAAVEFLDRRLGTSSRKKTWEAVISFQKELRKAKIEQPIAHMKIKTNKWVGIAFQGDLHLGNMATDYEQLRIDKDLIKNNDNLYLVINGDYCDNYISGSHTGGAFEALFPPAVQKDLAKDYIEDVKDKVLALVAGCHDLWSLKIDDFDLTEYLSKHGNAVYLGSGGDLFLQVGNVEYKIKMRHKYRFNSSDNATHTVKKMFEKEGGFDVGCFPAGTKVTEAPGVYKNIEDYKNSDIITLGNGKPGMVTETSVRKYTGDFHRINILGTYESVEATSEHPFYGIKREKRTTTDSEAKRTLAKDPDWFSVSELNVGDYVAQSIPSQVEELNNGNLFEQFFSNKEIDAFNKYSKHEINTNVELKKDIARLFGYYLAEGNLYKQHWTGQIAGVQFNFNIKEKRYIEDIKDIVKRYFNIEVKQYNRPKKSITELKINNKLLANLFYRTCGEYSHKKQLCTKLMCTDPAIQFDIFLGWNYGDGWTGTRDGYNVEKTTVVTTSKILAKQMYEILLRNNIIPALSQSNIEVPRKCKSYSLSIHEQRTERRIIKNGYLFTPITSKNIRQVSDIEVYNFTVNEPNTYIANGYTVHNCIAHNHIAAMEECIKEGLDGQNKRIFLRSGSYKTTDRYSSQMGFKDSTTGVPVVLFNPSERDMRGFQDLQEGIRYLNYLNNGK